jgi:hypothetical protein
MVTLTEVFGFIDGRIEVMASAAAGPCADAILDLVGRDEYREAVRKASALRALKILRKELAEWGASSEALLATAQPIVPPVRQGRRRKASV